MDRKENLEAEEILRAPMRRLRAALAAERSPQARRRQLMMQFVRLHRRPAGWLPWAMGMAAGLLVALAVTLVWRGTPWSVEGVEQRPRVEIGQPGPDIDNGALVELEDDNEFIPVPYSPPDGEAGVYVVRTELNAAALARMGLDLPSGYGDDFEADVLVGNDGFPCGVRVAGPTAL